LKNVTSVWAVIAALAVVSAFAREPDGFRSSQSVDDDEPVVCYAEHRVGRLVMPINNVGDFGYAPGGYSGRALDCFGNRLVTGFCEYPKGSKSKYISGGSLLLGAVKGQDTVVALSFTPSTSESCGMQMRSTVDPTKPWFEGAVSHYDLITTYYDTTEYTYYRSLDVEVTQSSYTWANDYAKDIILFDYSVKNIGTERLRYLFIAVDVGSAVQYQDLLYGGTSTDDKVGFLEYYPALYLKETCPPDSDLLYMGWAADDDADRTGFPQPDRQVPDITGLRFLRAPKDTIEVAFNWWTWNFGPQLRANYRKLTMYEYEGWSNYQWTEQDWYHVMSNGERDYDQAYLPTIPTYDATWVQPTAAEIEELSTYCPPLYMLSMGPFGLDPGQTLQFTTAFVAGLAFHRDAHIADYLPDNPYGWYQHVFFDQLARNAMWAEWIYDNPGYDTDGDGYAGEYVLCDLDEDSILFCDTLTDTSANPDTTYTRCRWVYNVADTMWVKGDGIADFRGAAPPPNPSTYRFVNKDGDTLRSLRVFPEVGRVRMVWNGAVTENTPDWFSHKYDFEGYRVYLALDDRPASFSLITSYDKENFNQWEFDYNANEFACYNDPFTLQELRCLHGDSCGDTTWSPFWYTRTNPLVIPGGPKKDDRIMYFEPMGDNRSILADDPVNANTRIRKTYPYAPRPPHIHPDSVAIYYPDRDDTIYFTPDGYMKYYEYEYTFDGLLATVPYYVNVTAFDFGYPQHSLPGLEGNPAEYPKAVYALPSSEVIADQNLEVFVYPNPYRIDADYRDRGYEGNQRWHLPEEKTREIHFANLPPKCTISILSLDGDLIRELKHDVDPEDYLANHDTWDLISRNSQMVVTGLYYWTVEDDEGRTQIGKLVIIM
jgi:hypothetical protein